MKYSRLCKVYQNLEKNSSRLKKISILSKFLKNLKKSESEIIYLLQGRVFPDYIRKELGISNKLMKKALGKLGLNNEKITKLWKEEGDLGTVAEKIVKKKSQKTLSNKKLTAEKVLGNIKKIAEEGGKGSESRKISLISELLTSASSLEARYVVRTILHDLRIGVGSGTIRDSIVKACFKKKKKKLVQEAYDKTADFSLVFEKAKKGEKALKNLELTPGKPVKVMLFKKEETIEDGFKRVGKPALIEYKYDGFRMMINKNKEEIKIFTRRLEEVTKQFPEVVEYVKKYFKGKSFILDAEAVGYDPKDKEYKPFQEISQRIKRKYDIEKLREKLPVEINVFDIIYHNGKSLLKKPLKERRKIIEKNIKTKKWKIRPSKALKTKNKKKAEKFYKKALEEGEEGIMMKNLEAVYKPGSRVGYGIKIKPGENEFDLVITGADYGTGKRAGWLTSFYISCRKKDKLLEVGKVSTGLKEKKEQGLSYKEMTEKLKEIEKETKGRHMEVKPEIVVTVTYQNIQKSPKYSSGFALRFPRFTKLRPDKDIDEIATIKEVKKEYGK